jgi:hypothetical protein
MAPNRFEPDGHVALVRNLYQYRQLQLLWFERDQSSLGDHPQYHRYMPNAWYLDRESRTWLGASRLALLATSGCWFRHARVGIPSLSAPRVVVVVGSDPDSYGTFVFNGLISPMCFAPPAAVQLPHEADLEETGTVPAAGAQSRAGFDIVPESDDRDR